MSVNPLARVVMTTACLMSTACAEREIPTVRFEPGRAIATWRDEDTNAGRDATAKVDASEPTDRSAADDAGNLASDAGNMSELDAGSDEPTPVAPKAISACMFRVTTQTLGGRYSPKNIGAIWVERGDGTWVKTLALWAAVRQRYLTTYLAANPTRNTTDAVTSATLRQHTTHEVSWNLRNGAGEPAPDGDYRMRVELTDRDGSGQVLNVPFTKSQAGVKLTPDGNEYFHDLALTCL
jgi:hypothetical protein